jgi:hypothetical protein
MASKAKKRENPCDVGWRSDHLDSQTIGMEPMAKTTVEIMISI